MLANAEHEAVQVNHADWRLYTLALAELRPFNMAIDVACREYAAARNLTGGDSILTAAKFFAEQQSQQLVAKNAPQLVEEFIQARASGGVSARGLADYRSRLRRFADAFHCPLLSITKDQLQEFLDSLGVGLRTKRNFKTNLVTLFNYARSKNCLPRDRKTEAEHLDAIEVPPGDIEIFPAKALAKLLSAADDALIPYLAIRAFAGIRDAELNRMEWRNIKFADRHIEVPASVAKKTRSRKNLRRLVPLLPNLEKWLAPFAGSDGMICVYFNSERAARKLAARIKVNWVHNGLRHGYGTCRVALTKNYPQVAYEMGNSVEVIKSCYDQVASEKEANAWFSICPTVPDNVVRLATAD